MRKILFLFLVLIYVTACSSAPKSVSSGPGRNLPRTDLTAVPGANEAEVVVQRGSDKLPGELVTVFIDGIPSAELAPNSSEKFILPNGSHSVSVSAMGMTSSTLQFSAGSNRIIFRVAVNIGPISTLILTKQSDSSLDPKVAAAESEPAARSLAHAIQLTAEEFIELLPEKARIAVVAITTADNQDRFAEDELTRLLVNSRKFSVVDRRNLDIIRSEQKFQMSGFVDDDTVISLGKLSGAETVIIGSVDGYGGDRRLTVKALDVQTGEIQTMSSQRF